MFPFNCQFLLFFFVSYSTSTSTVEYAAILYRHGDRTPVKPYPNDPYSNESLWPVKFGELTNLGTLQHYRLGQWIKNRYEHLLSEEYNPSDIYIRSTDTDRTISSALANLAGMFPANGKSVWNTDLLWRPIPVHTVPKEMDEILGLKSCPAYDESLNTIKNSKSYKDELLKYKSLMKYLSVHTGSVVDDYDDIEHIYSTLKIENENHFSLPNWTASVFPNEMKKPACHSFTVPTLKQDLARIKAGPLLKNIVHHMTKVAQNKSARKLSIYSAHDNNVANFLNALNIFDEHCPSFTATVFVELVNGGLLVENAHEWETQEFATSPLNYLAGTAPSSEILRKFRRNETAVSNTVLAPHIFVRILYRNSTEIVEPQVLHIPHCGQLCPLETFISLYQFLILVDWETDCAILTNFMILLCLSLFFFIVTIWFCKCYYCDKSRTLKYQQDYNANSY